MEGLREGQYSYAVTDGVARETNVVSNPEPVDRDKHWDDKALNVGENVRGLVGSYPHPFRLLRYLSCRASGLNGRRLIVMGSVSVDGGE